MIESTDDHRTNAEDDARLGVAVWQVAAAGRPSNGAQSMKVLLVDGQRLVGEGLALVLRRLAIELHVLHAASCEEAFGIIGKHGDIDLVLLDPDARATERFDGIKRFHERHPEMPVLVISGIDDYQSVRAAFDAGARGFIPKSSSSQIMLSAIFLVLAHGMYLPPCMLSSACMVAPTPPTCTESSPGAQQPTAVKPRDLGLTPRQTDVLNLVLQGKPIKLICRELKLCDSTIKRHVSVVLRALQVTTRTQAIVAAHRLGLSFE